MKWVSKSISTSSDFVSRNDQLFYEARIDLILIKKNENKYRETIISKCGYYSPIVESGYESRLITGVVLIDLITAYDTVNHQSLLIKI